MSQAPASRPRPGGGFNPGMGQINEHLDEQAMQQAVKQQALAQRSTQNGPIQQGSPGTTNPSPPGTPGAPPSLDAANESFFDAAITKPVQDLAKTILEAIHLDKLLEIVGGSDNSPEAKAKKQAMMKRYQQLTEEEQAVARQKYQERLQQEKIRKQEEEQKRQMEEQQKQASIQMPSSPQKGPVGPGSGQSKKGNAIQKLQQDRKTLGGPQSVG